MFADISQEGNISNGEECEPKVISEMAEKEVTLRKLELEERRLAIEERRLKLDEEKMMFDMKEREQRLRMEMREKEHFLAVSKNQQNILDFFIKNFTILSAINKKT